MKLVKGIIFIALILVMIDAYIYIDKMKNTITQKKVTNHAPISQNDQQAHQPLDKKNANDSKESCFCINGIVYFTIINNNKPNDYVKLKIIEMKDKPNQCLVEILDIYSKTAFIYRGITYYENEKIWIQKIELSCNKP